MTWNPTANLKGPAGATGPAGTSSLLLATKTSNYTLTSVDSVILSNGSSLTMTLPSAVTAGSGVQYTVKNLHSSNATVKATAGTLDGTAAATGVPLAQYQALTFTSDGADWWLI